MEMSSLPKVGHGTKRLRPSQMASDRAWQLQQRHWEVENFCQLGENVDDSVDDESTAGKPSSGPMQGRVHPAGLSGPRLK